MSEQSAKPYLVRAICEWCADNALTPYLAVKVNAETRVPAAFVKNGEIVLNIGPTATRQLKIDNERVQFNARFNGVSQEVAVPMAAITGIFAKETGYGFAFAAAQDPVSSLVSATVPRDLETAGKESMPGRKEKNLTEVKTGRDRGKPRARPSHLQVIK